MQGLKPLILSLLCCWLAACSVSPNVEPEAPENNPPLVEQGSEAAGQPGRDHTATPLEEISVIGTAESTTPAGVAPYATLKLGKLDRALHATVASRPWQPQSQDKYPGFMDHGLQQVSQAPLSTFSIDVDTASYANLRRLLQQGQLPPKDAVRVEELINYFSYDYPQAADRQVPFSVYTEIGPSPWDTDKRLLHIGINGWQPDAQANLPPANLVFLIDVSGSMRAPGKLTLLKRAMKMMVNQLRAEDHLSIAVYAGASGQVLAPTSGADKAKIHAAIEGLQAGGSTNGEAGIRLAYSLARQHWQPQGINRVILATDGDFNVGVTDVAQLQQLVEQQRQSGVALSVLGFGAGNYNDALMQTLAQNGNGNAAYIDSMHEARKVLVDEMGATLHTIAKDMKVQVEFNPALVRSYRLIGYETRHLQNEDFNNDRVDAGEVGAGHTVTAIYELTLVDAPAAVDPLRYAEATPFSASHPNEIGQLKIRYKQPDEQHSRLISHTLHSRDVGDDLPTTSDNFRFSAAVAWLGQILRHNKNVHSTALPDVLTLAVNARGADPFGYRSEFVKLVRTADQLVMPVNPQPDSRISNKQVKGDSNQRSNS